MERACGSLPYLIPLFDSLRYGRFLFRQYPVIHSILAPLQPLIALYFGFPLASLIIFLVLYSGVVNNTSVSQFIRLNTLQAILLSVMLVLPGLVETVLVQSPPRGLALRVYILALNAIWIAAASAVACGIAAALAGQTAKLPLVSNAARARLP